MSKSLNTPVSGKVKRVAPMPLPGWKGRKILAVFYRKMGKTRVKVGQKKLNLTGWRKNANLFRWKGRMYYLDPEQIFLLDKRPILYYDVDYAEPCGETNPVMVTKPENPGLEPHFSQALETLVQGKALFQALNAAKDKAGGNSMLMMIVFLAIGAVLGFFIGTGVGAAGQALTNSTGIKP